MWMGVLASPGPTTTRFAYCPPRSPSQSGGISSAARTAGSKALRAPGSSTVSLTWSKTTRSQSQSVTPPSLVPFRPRGLDALRLARHLREVRRIRRLAGSLRLFARDPLEQLAEIADGVVDLRLHVAELGEAARHRHQREVLGLERVELLPAERRRDGRVGTGADGVGRGDRPVAGVLVVVDEHALAALLLPPRGRDELRRTPLDLSCERERATAHLAEAPFRLDAAGDVDPAVPRRLRPAHEAELVERLLDDRGDLLRLGEAGARLRIDVDAELVRMLDVAAARRPGMEVDSGEVG